MKRGMLVAYSSDKLGLKVRWVLLLFWAFVAFGNEDPVQLGIKLGIAALAGLAVQFNIRNYDRYKTRTYKQVSYLRGFDILIACAASTLPATDYQSLWLLAVPILIFEALSSRSPKRVAMFTGTSVLILLYGGMVADNAQRMFAPIGSMLASGAIGIVLANFQAKDRVLSDRDRRLTTLMSTASNLAASGDLRNLILGTLKNAVIDLGASGGMVSLTSDEDHGLLVTEAAYGVQGDFHFPVVVGLGDGVTGYVAKMGQPITLTAKEGEILDIDGIGLPIRSAVSVPLVNREFSGSGVASSESIIGAMTIVNTQENDSLEAEELDLLQSLSSLLANAIHNARMEERQRATFLRTLESLATALEARDDYTRGHSQRVCDLSVMIGSRLGLMTDALEELRIGTILHDIGKIGVPDAILNKPGRLTNEEFDVMRSHPVIGYEICRPLMLSEGVLMIIRNHHEKLDGSGYPDGLKGGELPLSLRVVCVADAFDAMSSRRPYRGVMDMNIVIGELSKGAGIQFDPVVVEALKDLLNSGELDELYAAYWDAPARHFDDPAKAHANNSGTKKPLQGDRAA